MKTGWAGKSTIVLGMLVCGLALPAAGQWQPAAGLAAETRSERALRQEPQMDRDAQMTTSGVFLGVVGMLGGAAVGSGVGNARCGRACVGRSASGGAAIAGSLMVPIGVHIAAQPPQRLVRSLAVSALTGSLVWLGFNAIPGRPVALAPFVAAPIQVWTSMKIETRGR
jgi:hypothetical protein